MTPISHPRIGRRSGLARHGSLAFTSVPPVFDDPPEVTGSIADQGLTHTGNPVTIVADVSALFSGVNLNYQVIGYSGASINQGALEIDPTNVTAGTEITLRASNNNPQRAEITFNLTVTALAFNVLSLAGSGLVGGTHTVTATANRPGTTFSYDWRDQQGSIGAADQATFAATAGQDEENLFAAVTASVDGVSVTENTNAIFITQPAPTININPTAATIDQGALAGSVVAAVTLSGGPAVPTLSGTDAAMFDLTGSYPNYSLELVADANTLGTFNASVVANNSNAAPPTSVNFALTVAAAAQFGVENTGEELTITFDENAGSPSDPLPITYDGVEYTQDLYTSTILTRGFLKTAPVIALRGPTLTLLDGNTNVGARVRIEPVIKLFKPPDPGDSTFKFLRDGVEINGATSDIYTITVDDEGTTLTAEDDYVGNKLVTAGLAIAAADNTAPILSSPSAAVNGTNGLNNISVDTDEGNGFIHYGAWLTSATPPGQQEVIAGTEAIVLGADTDVVATGTQALGPLTGLAANTSYTVYYVHVDDAGNPSAVQSFGPLLTESNSITPEQVQSAGLFAQFDATDFDPDEANPTPTVQHSSGDVDSFGNKNGSSTLSLLPNLTPPTTGLATPNFIRFSDNGYLQDTAGVVFTESGTIIWVHAPGVQSGSSFDSLFGFNGASDFQFENGAGSTSWHGEINSTSHGDLRRETPAPAGLLIQVYRWDFSINYAELFTNGVRDASVSNYDTAYSTTGTRYALGTNRNGSQHYTGDFYAMPHFDGAISYAELNSVCQKYVQDLGATWSPVS